MSPNDQPDLEEIDLDQKVNWDIPLMFYLQPWEINSEESQQKSQDKEVVYIYITCRLWNNGFDSFFSGLNTFTFESIEY